MNSLIVPLILSGGAGIRLWPISNARNPKQFMNLGNGISMLQNTLIRLKKIKNLSKPIILCNKQHELKLVEQLKKIGEENIFIIVEPVSRSTAPALTSALLKLSKIKNRDDIYLIMPSDHYVSNISSFDRIIQEGFQYAKNGYIVTFGVTPTHPETGYGYIKKGVPTNTNIEQHKAFYIEKFIEKPNSKTSSFYFNSGQYFWNSGIFMFRSDVILEKLKHFASDIVTFCKMAVDKGTSKSNTFYLEKKFFSQSPNNSIDYAVMEKTDDSVVIPMNIDWKDLGSWESLFRANEKNRDFNGNILKGKVITHKTRNSYIRAENRLVTTVGVNDHVIIETSDSVLVVPLSKTQDVKQMVLESNLHEINEDYLPTKKHYKWGTCEKIFISETITISLIIITPNSSVNIEKNFEPEANWIIVSGKAIVSNGICDFYLNEKDFIKIKCTPGYIMYNFNKTSIKIVQLKKKNSFKQVEF